MKINYIECCDCLDGIKEIPDASVDCIITDPPYFVNMGHAGSKDTAKNFGMNTNRAFSDLNMLKPFFRQLYSEFARVLKPDGSFYIFCDWKTYPFFYPLVSEFLPVRNCIVWDKLNGPGSYYTFSHEFIIFGTNAPKLLNKGGTNVIKDIKAFSSGAKATNGEKIHPTQKPVELIKKLIQDSTREGDIVLDTFLGSGTTAAAAYLTGRRYIGFEISEEYFDKAVKRLEALN